MTPLSVVIVTYNEERNIGNCIEAVLDIADEIVVVDAFSTDRTREICASYKAKVIEHAFAGFIEQKNYATSQATFQHVLSLDADEVVSPELLHSIAAVKNNWQFDGYYMNRLSSFCGKWIRHSGWYPDRKLRLFDKSKGAFGGTNPHDRFKLVPKGRSARLKGDLLHHTAETEASYRAKVERYAITAAAEMFQQQRTVGPVMVYLKSVATFLRNYVIRLGILDGAEGWKICMISAGYTFKKYQKLRVLNKQKES